MIFEYVRKIYGYECDIYGHLNNANYLHLYEEARSDCLTKMGIPIKTLNALDLQIFVTHIEEDFLKGVKLEEIVVIKSSPIKITRVKSIWKQDLYNEKGFLCNSLLLIAVFTRNGKPIRITKSMFENFYKYLEN